MVKIKPTKKNIEVISELLNITNLKEYKDKSLNSKLMRHYNACPDLALISEDNIHIYVIAARDRVNSSIGRIMLCHTLLPPCDTIVAAVPKEDIDKVELLENSLYELGVNLHVINIKQLSMR